MYPGEKETLIDGTLCHKYHFLNLQRRKWLFSYHTIFDPTRSSSVPKLMLLQFQGFTHFLSAGNAYLAAFIQAETPTWEDPRCGKGDGACAQSPWRFPLPRQVHLHWLHQQDIQHGGSSGQILITHDVLTWQETYPK